MSYRTDFTWHSKFYRFLSYEGMQLVYGANVSGVMVQDGGCGHIVNTRISGGRVGFGFSTQGSARLSNCTVANVHLGVSIVINKPAEVIMEDNKISAKLLVLSTMFSIV